MVEPKTKGTNWLTRVMNVREGKKSSHQAEQGNDHCVCAESTRHSTLHAVVVCFPQGRYQHKPGTFMSGGNGRE